MAEQASLIRPVSLSRGGRDIDLIAFRETQSFRQRWLWGLLLLSSLLAIGLMGHGLFTQMIRGQPWGHRPLSDAAFIVTSAVAILATVGFLYFFYRLRLTTEVRADGVHVRFWPLRPRTIRFSDIKSSRAVVYRPLRDYGGWGIRYGKKGKAYSVSGNTGVQLVLRPGRMLLIGSQRPQDLARAINAHLSPGQG